MKISFIFIIYVIRTFITWLQVKIHICIYYIMLIPIYGKLKEHCIHYLIEIL